VQALKHMSHAQSTSGKVRALEAGNTALAVHRMRAHIDNVARHLAPEPIVVDPASALRSALTGRARPSPSSSPRLHKEFSE
jgi:hypothetical protein